jgi:hypothetical protein
MLAKRSSTIFLILFFVSLFPASYVIAQSIPTPEETLGFKVGADYHLATYEQAIEYLKNLAQSSNRIKLFSMGKTSMGKDMLYAIISSEQNMAELEKYHSIMTKLSLVKGLTNEEARELAKEGKAVVYIDGGLHASECAPAQHNIQLAYDLVSGQDKNAEFILNNTILLLVFANPDGMTMLANWYHHNVGTPYEVSPMPWLYHKYVGHDNNRDSYFANQIETQNITKLVNQEWYPNILYNHHQTAPFPARIWIPPNSEPTNPNVHPLLVRWSNLIGSAMGAAFDEAGQDGAVSRIIFDSWYPGYVTQVVDSHNVISILTETALYRYATPHFYTVDDFPKEYQDFTISAFYPSPWKGGWWHIKDAVDYCLTASKAVLYTAAKYHEELLYDKYKMGKDTIERFSKESPYGWIIPAEQWDAPTAAVLLNKMIMLGIDVYKAKDSFIADGITYPRGTYVIPMTQAFALFIKNVFEVQHYPDLRKYPALWQGLVRPVKFEGAPLSPYDAAAWTLPYQTGVKVLAANSSFKADLEKIDEVIPAAGKIEGKAGYAYTISPAYNNAFAAANRILQKNGKVLRAKQEFSSGNKKFLAGSFIIPAHSISSSILNTIAKDLSLEITGLAGKPSVSTYTVKSPKIGLYKPWTASMDEGWIRWLLEQYEFPYQNISNADIKAGNLVERFDVIIVPDVRPSTIINGYPKGYVPPNYAGGIEHQGVLHLKEFVAAGGTLLCLEAASNFAIDEFNLPVKDSLKDVEAEEFSCPGSLLRMEFDNNHPVAYGMPEKAVGFFSRDPAFSIQPSFKDNEKAVTVAKYPAQDLLMSGYLVGGNKLYNKSCIVEVEYKKGRIILFGFAVHNRAQSLGTIRLLFNALLYGASS